MIHVELCALVTDQHSRIIPLVTMIIEKLLQLRSQGDVVPTMSWTHIRE
jgi:predicted phosphatase